MFHIIYFEAYIFIFIISKILKSLKTFSGIKYYCNLCNIQLYNFDKLKLKSLRRTVFFLINILSY